MMWFIKTELLNHYDIKSCHRTINLSLVQTDPVKNVNITQTCCSTVLLISVRTINVWHFNAIMSSIYWTVLSWEKLHQIYGMIINQSCIKNKMQVIFFITQINMFSHRNTRSVDRSSLQLDSHQMQVMPQGNPVSMLTPWTDAIRDPVQCSERWARWSAGSDINTREHFIWFTLASSSLASFPLGMRQYSI